MSTIQRHTLRTVHQAVAQRADFNCNDTLTGRSGISGTWGSRLPEKYHDKFRADVLADDAYVVRSYATPIAWVTHAGHVHYVRQRFSVTTSKHQSLIWRLGEEPA